jgi:hypothetical protein
MENKRRKFLAFAVGAVSLGAVGPRPASALRVEDLDMPRQRLLLQACETRTAHEKLLADLTAEIEGRGALPQDARTQAAQSDCPFCGCRLAAFDTLLDLPRN